MFAYVDHTIMCFVFLIMYFAANFIFCLRSVFMRWPRFRVSRTFVFTHYALPEQILSSVCILFLHANRIFVCLVCSFVHIMLFRTEYYLSAFCFHTLTSFSWDSYVCFYTLCCLRLDFIVSSHFVCIRWPHIHVFRIFNYVFRGKIYILSAFCIHTLTSLSRVSYVCVYTLCTPRTDFIVRLHSVFIR